MENAAGNGSSQAAQSSSAAATNDGASLNQLETLLQRLGDKIAGPLEEAEQSVASHPLSSAGAAFVLGLVIGRLTKRG